MPVLAPQQVVCTRLIQMERFTDCVPEAADILGYELEDTVAGKKAAKIVGDDFKGFALAVAGAWEDGSLKEAVQDATAWKAWVKALGKDLERKGKQLFMPLRVAMTGRMQGGDVGLQLEVVREAAGSLGPEAPILGFTRQALPVSIDAAPCARAGTKLDRETPNHFAVTLNILKFSVANEPKICSQKCTLPYTSPTFLAQSRHSRASAQLFAVGEKCTRSRSRWTEPPRAKTFPDESTRISERKHVLRNRRKKRFKF